MGRPKVLNTFDWSDIEYASPEYYRRWRLANNDHSRRYHRAYDKRMYKEKLSRETARRKRYNNKYPERIKANRKLNYAVKKGYITKLPCNVCNDVKSVAHHDDWDKPLEVIWLCELHHKARHRELA